jgi:hypothetical protein
MVLKSFKSAGAAKRYADRYNQSRCGGFAYVRINEINLNS